MAPLRDPAPGTAHRRTAIVWPLAALRDAQTRRQKHSYHIAVLMFGDIRAFPELKCDFTVAVACFAYLS
jgi:hypothetical protein